MLCKDLIFKKEYTTSLYDEEIKDPPNQYDKFLQNKIIRENSKIRLDTVQGMCSRESHEITWYGALKKLRRRHTNLDMLYCTDSEEVKNNPCFSIQYYTNLEYRSKYDISGWRIVFINDIGYISEGNHRTTVAKFLASLSVIPNEIIIPVVEYNSIDLDSLMKVQVLQKRIDQILLESNGDIQIHIDINNKEIDDTTMGNERSLEYMITYTLNVALEKYAYNSYTQIYNTIEELEWGMSDYLMRNYKEDKDWYFKKFFKKIFAIK